MQTWINIELTISLETTDNDTKLIGDGM